MILPKEFLKTRLTNQSRVIRRLWMGHPQRQVSLLERFVQPSPSIPPCESSVPSASQLWPSPLTGQQVPIPSANFANLSLPQLHISTHSIATMSSSLPPSPLWASMPPNTPNHHHLHPLFAMHYNNPWLFFLVLISILPHFHPATLSVPSIPTLCVVASQWALETPSPLKIIRF